MGLDVDVARCNAPMIQPSLDGDLGAQGDRAVVAGVEALP
jgi:hypothetical protein